MFTIYLRITKLFARSSDQPCFFLSKAIRINPIPIGNANSKLCWSIIFVSQHEKQNNPHTILQALLVHTHLVGFSVRSCQVVCAVIRQLKHIL